MLDGPFNGLNTAPLEFTICAGISNGLPAIASIDPKIEAACIRAATDSIDVHQT